MSEVTQILYDIAQGDRNAASQLLPLVYEELRKLSAQKLARETPGQTLQPTALVHEAYLRLVGKDGTALGQPGAFLRGCRRGDAAHPGRDRAQKASLKRGGDRQRVEAVDSLLASPEPARRSHRIRRGSHQARPGPTSRPPNWCNSVILRGCRFGRSLKLWALLRARPIACGRLPRPGCTKRLRAG